MEVEAEMLGHLAKLLGIRHELGPAGKRAVMTGAVAVVSVTGVTLATVGPVFSDADTVKADFYATATLDIAASPARAAISLTGMAPGDQITGVITLSNEGTLPARYAMRSVASEDQLASALQMTVKTGVTNCDSEGFSVDGDVLYGPGAAGSVAGVSPPCSIIQRP